MCIFYVGKINLHYTSGEHIFPAGLGGIKKLPEGYVSDEFNNDISKIEQPFLRNSIFSLPRILLGPGKRGSLNENKATKSRIHLVTSNEDPNILALGYTKLAQTIEIPSIKLDFRTKQAALSLRGNLTESEFQDAIQKFKDECANKPLKMREVISAEIPDNIVLIGIKGGIEENSNCFIFRNSEFKIAFDDKSIKAIVASTNYEGKTGDFRSYMPSVQDTIDFRDDYLRVFGKIAFNFLASKIGAAAMKDTCFDPIRNWIALGGENRFASINQSIKESLNRLGITLPDDSHLVLVLQGREILIANVILYNHFSVQILLSEKFTGDISLDGLVCDWKNKREFNFHELYTTRP